MKTSVKSFLAMVMLASTLSAEPVFLNEDFREDFGRLSQYMTSHFDAAYLDSLTFPRVNISEEKENYVFKFDLAGLLKDEIKLSIDQNNVLTVEGERKTESEEKEKSFVKQEFYYGQFKRSVQLPENANQDKLDTKYKDGILTVTIGKKVVNKPSPKIIKIK